MKKALVVYVTATSRKEADNIARALVAEKLAACVSLVPQVTSRFWWRGKIESAKEHLLVIKTLPRLYKPLEKHVRKLHSSSVPEILAMPVVRGSAAYLRWMKESLR